MGTIKKFFVFTALICSVAFKAYAMDDDPTFTRENLLLLFGQHPYVSLKVETMESFEAVGSPKSKCLFFQFKVIENSSNQLCPAYSFDMVLGDHYESDQIHFKLTDIVNKLMSHRACLMTRMLTQSGHAPLYQPLIDCINSCLRSVICHEKVPNSVKVKISSFIAQ